MRFETFDGRLAGETPNPGYYWFSRALNISLEFPGPNPMASVLRIDTVKDPLTRRIATVIVADWTGEVTRLTFTGPNHRANARRWLRRRGLDLQGGGK